MKEKRSRIQMRLPVDVIEKMKQILPTDRNNNFSGDALSIYIENLVQTDLIDRGIALKSLTKESQNATA